MRILQAAALCPVLVLLVITPWGCGKKGPPQVPRAQPLPVVENPGVARDNQTLILRWSLPPEKGREGAEVVGFAVYRAKAAIDANCPDCPHPYEMIGRVARRSAQAAPATWQFRDRVAAGYVYRYRVRCYDPAGRLGRASDPVKYVVTQYKDAGDKEE